MLALLSFLALIILVISGINAGISFYKYKYFQSSLKIIVGYLVFSFLIEGLSYGLAKNRINNLFVFHINSLIEYVFMYFFFENLFKEIQVKRNFKIFLIVGVGLLIVNSLFIQRFTTFNSYGLTFVSLSILTLCIYFFKILIEKGSDGLLFERHKWIVFGIFLYHAVSILVLLFSNRISTFEDTYQFMIWISRNLLIIVAKLLITFALLNNFENKKQ